MWSSCRVVLHLWDLIIAHDSSRCVRPDRALIIQGTKMGSFAGTE
jgi:hypothetical protein